jgi:23S rRNA (adenine2503-C2)-methyltransferase
MDLNKLRAVLRDQPKYRVKQAEEAIFSELIDDWDKATSLPKGLREQLKTDFPLTINGEIFETENKKTTKALITLEDGQKVETVLMNHKTRFTACVSSQVGCALNCGFCATGKMGFSRDLTYDEIILQVLFLSRYIRANFDLEDRVTNIVFMGMGEPFLNYDSVLKAVNILNDETKFNIGARKISISTSGIIPGIEKLTKEKIQVNLALSLHAPNDELRTKLMPINRKYPLKEVIKSVDKYIKVSGRKVMIEYLLIKGENDDPKYAKQLATLLKDKLYVVNLIPCNPVGDMGPSTPEVVTTFGQTLEKLGISTTQRYTFGREIDAACGQLANKRHQKNKR